MAKITPEEEQLLADGIYWFVAASREQKLDFIAKLRHHVGGGLDEMADLFVRIMTDQEASDADASEQSREAAGAA